MRNIVFILIAVFIIGCKPEHAVKDSVLFSGTIENPNKTGFVLSKGDFNKEIKLDEAGNFSELLTGVEEGVYSLWDSVESTKLYLIPGKDLQLFMNAKEFDESITYKGEGAAASNYLAKKLLFEETLDTDFRQLYSLDEADFKNSIDSLASAREVFLAGFTDLPDEFANVEKKSIAYNTLGFISNYKGAHSYYTKNDDFEPSASFLAPLESIAFDDEDAYKNIESYQRLVITHFTSGEILENIGKLGQITSPLIKMDVIRNLKYYMSPGSEDLDSVYIGLKAHSTDPKFTSELNEQYTKYLTLAKGKTSPGFNYPDTKGNMVSLKSLLGKAVYIDVWATWCGPCRAEIPYLKQLESEYHDKGIAFVSMSIDKMADKDKWMNMVADEALQGIQLFADKDWESDFAQAYGIQSIPRFILVDQEGKIVSADAPRPSSDSEIREMINGLGI